MKIKTKHALAALTLTLVTIAGTVSAANAPEDRWRFGVIVPIWAAGIDGDMTIRGRQVDVDVGFDDLKDHLDASFSLGLEARRDRFGFYGAVGYMKFSADDTLLAGAEAEAELKFLIAEAGGFYGLLRLGEERPFVLEALGGVRYWAIDNELEITGPGGTKLFDGGDEKDLIDPIIGLRASQFLTRKLHLDFQGDIGGFGISDDTSDFAWSATGLVTYDLARWFSLSAGYKALAVEAERGSGTSERGVDIIMHGLLLAAKFTF